MRIYRNRLERQHDRKESLHSGSETMNRPRQMFGNIVGMFQINEKLIHTNNIIFTFDIFLFYLHSK